MSIVSLEDARKEQTANLGQQAPKGYRQKTKAQLLREQMQLEAANREQGRLQAMARWYAASRPVIMDIYNVLGFPMHRDETEKATQIVAALLGLSATINANTKSDIEPIVDAFRTLCQHEKERLEADEVNVLNQKQAAVVAALIYAPTLAQTEGIASPVAAIDEPWLGFAKILLEEPSEGLKDREEAAFAYFKDVKIGEGESSELAVTFLRQAMDRMKGLTVEERVEGWKVIVPELLREKVAKAVANNPTTDVEPTPIVSASDTDAEQAEDEIENEIAEHEAEPGESDARVS
jgi:hypothetical protein